MKLKWNSFISNTTDRAKQLIDSTKMYINHIVRSPYDWCASSSSANHTPDLKPRKHTKIDVNDWNIGQHKLSEYSGELGRIINEPFVKKHMSWFTDNNFDNLTVMHILCQCRKRRNLSSHLRHRKGSPNQLPRTLNRILPRRRPII